MKIGIIGTGVVGQQLAVDLFNLGHEITIGTRDPQKLAEFSQRHPDVKLGDNAEAARFGEWIVLATSWSGTQNAVELAGPEHLSGKILIDITNPLDFSTGKPTLAVGHTTSAGELVQAWAPECQSGQSPQPGDGQSDAPSRCDWWQPRYVYCWQRHRSQSGRLRSADIGGLGHRRFGRHHHESVPRTSGHDLDHPFRQRRHGKIGPRV